MKTFDTEHRPAPHRSVRSPSPYLFSQPEADRTSSARRARWRGPWQRICRLGRIETSCGRGAFGSRPDRLLRRLNNRVAVAGTKAFGTMWACYCFVIFGLAPLIDPLHQATYLYWSNVIQLVALPMLMVGTTRIGAELESRTRDAHDPGNSELAHDAAGPGHLALHSLSAQVESGSDAGRVQGGVWDDNSEFASSGSD